MPTLSCHFAIYTDGDSLQPLGTVPAGIQVSVRELSAVVLPGPDDELFGPHANLLSRASPKRCVVLGFRSTHAAQRADPFFHQVRSLLIRATSGVKGIGLDVLRLWPFPLEAASKVMPEELIADDLYSVGFTEMGEHGIRTETIGFAKLGARELSFEFTDRVLTEDAAMLCGQLGDWLFEHGRPIRPGQTMSFGFDRLVFLAPEGEQAQDFRGWHPPLVQRLLFEGDFQGVGVFEVHAVYGEATEFRREDLTAILKRARAQRLLLEKLRLRGDSPNASTAAQIRGALVGLRSLMASREESASTKDSGWYFESTETSGRTSMAKKSTLGDVARLIPDIIPYLAMPAGSKLTWDQSGELSIDRSRIDANHLRDESEGE